VKHNRVRVIGGTWRSRVLRFPDSAGLRPTSDRVRETLFNWLGQDLSGKQCLDLFAGSGALGFEAASRGAKRVLMVERDRAAHAALQANCQALHAAQVEIVRVDALDFLRGTQDVYDVIFLDPPFRDAAAGMWAELFARLPPHMAREARVYCESGGALAPPPGWCVYRSGRAGQVHFQLLEHAQETHEP
jgi:16S rRNA (guanine966-N2)-methyltransferase